MRQRSLALADRPEGRPLQDRSTESIGGSTENCIARYRKIDLYQIGTDAADREIDVIEGEFAADRVAG